MKEEKQPCKADLKKKIEAWKTLNSVLVETNNNFFKKLIEILNEKEKELAKLKEKLENNKGTEEENALFLYLGGYTQALKDITGMKSNG